VLAIASAKMLHESLTKVEIGGILLTIVAVTLIGLSKLSISVTQVQFFDAGFLTRIAVFTIVLFALFLVAQIFIKLIPHQQSIFLILQSGFVLAVSNCWMFPLTGTITHVFSGEFDLNELLLFIVSCFFVVLTNATSVVKVQKSFITGQANKLIPIQYLPFQTAPIFIYFYVYALSPPFPEAVPYCIIGLILILVSVTLLSKRQAELNAIKISDEIKSKEEKEIRTDN
jgi:signal transduction histidine kinase